MRVFLLAAGSQERWRRAGVTGLKQLIELRGEPVIARAYRLAREHTDDVVTVVKDPADPVWADWNPVAAGHERWMGEMGKFLDHWDHWPDAGEVAVIYGDVFYTQDTMATILDPGPVTQPTVYGRANCPGRQHESFGLRWNVERDWQEVVRIAHECCEHGMNRQGGPWRWFYRRHTGGTSYATEIVARLATPENGWVECGHDETDDFDSPEDLRLWKEAFS